MMCWHRSRSTSHTAQRCKTANVSMQEQAKFPNLNVQRNHSVSCSKTQSPKCMQQEDIAPSVTPCNKSQNPKRMYNAHSVQYSDRQTRSPSLKTQRNHSSSLYSSTKKRPPKGSCTFACALREHGSLSFHSLALQYFRRRRA